MSACHVESISLHQPCEECQELQQHGLESKVGETHPTCPALQPMPPYYDWTGHQSKWAFVATSGNVSLSSVQALAVSHNL